MTQGPFSTRSGVLLGVAVGVSLGAMLVLWAFGPELGRERAWGADSHSHSAVGHAAFVSLLDALDVPHVVSSYDTASRLGDGTVLVVIEPRLEMGPELGRMLASASEAFLVLPKWEPKRDPKRPSYVGSVGLVEERGIRHLLREAGISAHVRRTNAPGPWQGADAVLDWPLPLVQLFESDDFEPVLATSAGTLIGEDASSRPGKRVHVLADPDLISNMGLHRGTHAALLLDWLGARRPRGDRVFVIDETLHGYVVTPSIWRDLLRWPLVLILVQLLVVGVVILWAGVGRFGAPRPPAPVVEPGNRALVRSTAGLLAASPERRALMADYADLVLRRAAASLGAPPTLRGDRRTAWLDRVGRSRGAPPLGPLLEGRRAAGEPSHADMLRWARRLHAWREDLNDGR